MELSYSKVSAESSNVARFIAHAETEAADGLHHHCWMLKYEIGSARWGRFKLPWEACSLTMRASPDKEVLLISPDGMVGRGYGGFREEGELAAAPQGPVVHGPMREIRACGAAAVAVGMSRQVYRWSRDAGWEPLHTQAMVERNDVMDVFGFNSVAGDSADRFLAVGFAGEIWEYAGNAFKRADSPTNVALHRVTMVDGGAAAVGQAGVVLRMRDGAWSEYHVIADAGDIWDVCHFGQGLFVGTANALYRIADDGSDPEQVHVPGVSSFGHVDAAEGVIWTVGHRDIAWSRDGLDWHVVTP